MRSADTDPTSQGMTAPPPLQLKRQDLRAVLILVASFTAVYAITALYRHWHFDTSVDLGIFDQAVWHLSRLDPPASSIKGFNLFGDHFHPIIVLFVPFYWLYPGPESLIVGQAFYLATSILPVFLFLRGRFGRGHTIALCAAYGLFWGMQRTANFDVHEMAFAPTVVAIVVLALDRRNWALLWIGCLLLAAVKEDLIPVATFAGVYLVLQGERKRGAVLIVLSLVTFAAIVRVVIPWFSGLGYYPFTNSYRGILLQPWTALATFVTPATKLATVFMWLAPFLFLPLRSPYALLLVPLAAVRFLSESPNHWGTSFHYTAPLAPILAMSAGDGLSRLVATHSASSRARVLTVAVVCALVVSSLLPGRQPAWRLFSPRHYRPVGVEQAAHRALSVVPAGASVVAQAALIPHLSQRPAIYMLEESAPDADFIVATTQLDAWPIAGEDALRALIDKRQQKGYRTVFEEDGWVVLQRSGLASLEPVRVPDTPSTDGSAHA